MKSFSQFISEQSASQQAARMGLDGNGHGDWYNKEGEFVANTVGGKLKFYNKRQRTPGQDPPQTERERNQPHSTTDPGEAQVQPQGQAAAQDGAVEEPLPVQSPDLAAGPPPVPKTKGTLTIGFGRFNPPHAGHLKLMDLAAQSAEEGEEGGDYMIVPSRTNDHKKNPLDPDSKVQIMRQLFPQHSERIINDPQNRTIFDILKKAHNDGYANVRIIGGEDRVKQFDKLSQNYNGALYQFDNLETISSGERDEDSEGTEGYSASKMRLAAAEDDFATFYQQLQQEVENEDGEIELVPIINKKGAKEYFKQVRSAMRADEIKEFWNIWEIAPKDDAETLRDIYIEGNIFKLDQLVEDVNTGLRGKIIRRGTSYLICVTEDNIMFKSWVKDLMEIVKPAAQTGKYGVPSKQREVGTPELRKYAQSMVPGQGVINNLDIKEFINKYRKK